MEEIMKEVKICLKCGSENPRQRNYCETCWASLAGAKLVERTAEELKMTTSVSTEKSPWGRGTLLIVALCAGFAASGILAGINWRRMGKPGLVWPTIAVSIVAFILFGLFLGETTRNSSAHVVSLSVAWGLWLWQKGHHDAWERSHPKAQRAGWQIPLITVIVISGIIIGLVFLVL